MFSVCRLHAIEWRGPLCRQMALAAKSARCGTGTGNTAHGSLSVPLAVAVTVPVPVARRLRVAGVLLLND